MRIHLHEVVRSPGQKLVPVQMSEEFIEQVNAALPKLGYSDRSKFIREAIVEKLAKEGIIVPPEITVAPARIGKTGPKSQKEPPREEVITHERKARRSHAEQQYETGKRGAILKKDKEVEEAAAKALKLAAGHLPKK